MYQQELYIPFNHFIDKTFLCLSIICLGLKDILPNMGISVLPLLALIFLLPCIIIVREILHRRMSRKSIWLIGCVVCFYIAIIPLNLNGIKLFLPLFLSAVAFKDIDFRFIVKSFFFMEVMVLLMRCILIQNDILEVNYTYTDKVADGVSYDLGYGNPNTPGITIFVTLCCLYILMYRRWRWLSFSLILIISIISFKYSASRTSFFACILLLLTYLVPENFLKRYVYNKLFLSLIHIILVAFIFLTEFLTDFNTLVSGRINNLHIVMNMFSSPSTFLTGLQSDMVGNVDFPVDNGIAFMLCIGGAAAVGIFICRYFQLVKYKDLVPTAMLSVIVVMFISGIGEKTIANFGVAGGSLFWMLLFNASYLNDAEENSWEEDEAIKDNETLKTSAYES